MRHYSKVIIGVPDGPMEPQELTIEIDCDVCGVMEWRTHIAHFGTLVRTLTNMYDTMTDDGTTKGMGTFQDHAAAIAYLNEAFPEWKVGRIRQR